LFNYNCYKSLQLSTAPGMGTKGDVKLCQAMPNYATGKGGTTCITCHDEEFVLIRFKTEPLQSIFSC